MKHRMAVAGALAIGVMIAFLMVGRARAAEVTERSASAAGAGTQVEVRLTAPLGSSWSTVVVPR